MCKPLPLLQRPALRLFLSGRHLHCYQISAHSFAFGNIVLPGILELHPDVVQVIIRHGSGHIPRHIFTADELCIPFQRGIRRIGAAVRHGSCSCYHRLTPFNPFVKKLNHREQSLPPLLNHGHRPEKLLPFLTPHFESLDVVDEVHYILTGSKQLVPEQ